MQGGGLVFKSVMEGATPETKCYMLNIPEDLSLGFQVVAFGDKTCDTWSPQTAFVAAESGVLESKGFKTTQCDSTSGCCIQAAVPPSNTTGSNNTAVSSLAMAVCDPTAQPLQQFEFENLKGAPGRIREKATGGRCLSIRSCDLDVSHQPDAPERVCVAVDSGRAPDANSSLAGMVIEQNTGDFAGSNNDNNNVSPHHQSGAAAAGGRARAPRQSDDRTAGAAVGGAHELGRWLEQSARLTGKKLSAALALCQAEEIETVAMLQKVHKKGWLDRLGFKLDTLANIEDALELEPAPAPPPRRMQEQDPGARA